MSPASQYDVTHALLTPFVLPPVGSPSKGKLLHANDVRTVEYWLNCSLPSRLFSIPCIRLHNYQYIYVHGVMIGFSIVVCLLLSVLLRVVS